ncbi:pyridine nucleotide-disulfide oxidoreductase [Mycobacterium florentinum]|uniref:Pyridine nucleotide-disulfide oxidoreductase n=1 Tax=Mycobacterium florentinum TaxID=292462 RepID=A0A1X1UGJ8_MYCFL|nr:FAD-dependent oxidoreductase [Mycobacterium florentinum]ORV55966.1 pyridine nucleotide-disulfide oxidoreductase [Mycobacterium florentinum]BBX76392.1 pyridine nucleotide-disulfide oxidoreductase [Mycobacterium florentinum]
MPRHQYTADVTSLEVDLAVIGFGKGGKTLAAALGKRGWRVVMIEQSPLMYGGTCINIGCVPTKSMVFRSEYLDAATTHPDRYREAVAATAHLTASLRDINYATLDRIDTVTVLTGHASFKDSHALSVKTVDGQAITITAQWIVVGTGSRPVLPPVPGLADAPGVYTSTDLLSTAELPGRLTVLGGGYVGVEFAAMYAAYGSRVALLDRGPRVLGREDDDVADCARDILVGRGIDVVTSAAVTAVSGNGDGGSTVSYRVGGVAHDLDTDAILVALGREPVTDGLDLDAAGVETTDRGAIVVDDHLRSSQPHIFAVGDVNGGPQFTYISLDDYRVVLSQLAGDGTRSTATRAAVPYALFMTPPLARVGLTEKAAREAHDVKVATMRVADMATMPRARIVDEDAGLMKVVVDAGSDTILGAALLSYDSHEVINTVALAMRHGITASELRDSIYTHPSMTEGFNSLLAVL